jgi:hypothetical protein
LGGRAVTACGVRALGCGMSAVASASLGARNRITVADASGPANVFN